MTKEEAYHIQRVKKRWAVEGDRNSSFFHHAIIKRNRKNRITHLVNPDGTHSTIPDQLAATLTNYFTKNFTTSNPTHLNSNSHSHSSTQTSTDGNQVNRNIEEEEAVHNNDLFRYTYSIPDLNEIHDIVRNMRSNAAPGPDGFNAAFYKSSWHWAKDDIYKVVKNFYTHARLPADLNQSFITLIPKKIILLFPKIIDLLACVMSSTK